MPFVVHEQTGSKVFSDPKLCEECLLHDQTHRQLIPWVKLPRMACISRDFDYFIMHKSKFGQSVREREFPTIIKVLVNTLLFNVSKRNFDSIYIRIQALFYL